MAENQLDESQGPSNLQYLPALKYLNLDSNSLSSFTVSSEGEPSACPNLKVMSLRNNRLESISLPPSQLPCLREIWLDNNRLSSLAGLEKQQDLDIISVRNQHPPLASTLDGIFSHMPDARSIMLSGNHTPSLSVTYGRFFLNTTHLELASCGLASLPEEFGIAIPNLKSLNVNFNNLKDVRPLLGIKRLERLYLAGNRISRLRKLAMVLDRLGTDMREADLRNNPVTVGFYDTAASTALEDHGIKPLPAPAPEMGMQVVPATSTASPSTALHFFDGLDSSSSEMTKYIVPKANIIAQATYATRLDEDTKLRRRVYEMLLANGMPKLAAVDGLPFERKKVLVRDSIWERLVELGVVRKSERQGKA